MNWIEASLYTATGAVEAVCAALYEAGITGVQIEDAADMKNFLSSDNGQWDYVDEALLAADDAEACIKFYLSDDSRGRESLKAAEAAVSALANIDIGADPGRLAFESKVVDDADWLDNWKKHYKPFTIGKKVAVRPVWEDYDATDGRIVFTIDPGHVFGTGLHQTTQLCIERLEELVSGETELLDLGCGSGILSIIARLLGARSALAVDVDPNAVDIAYANAALNGITDNFCVLSGDAVNDAALRSRICRQKYGVVTANIVADVIIALSGLIEDCIADGGFFIASGIIDERLDDVRKALTGGGFEIVSEHIKDGWVCVVSRRT